VITGSQTSQRRQTWLHQAIYVSGGSRGSEAALLLGVHYPNLVHAVIASSPSGISFGAYPGSGAAWTFDGKPVPYSPTFSAARPVIDPAADIAVRNIRGPVFLDCGTADLIWTSCAYAATANPKLYGRAQLWLDVGAQDPSFTATDEQLANVLHIHLHMWPGGHDFGYWNAHWSDYLGFYAHALATCG
jgi:pimeloyl-ACP methyl ester carboxylesterase